jgi:hypothetical protein
VKRLLGREVPAMRVIPLLLLAVPCGLGAAAEPVPEWAKGVSLTMPLGNTKEATNMAFSDPAVWQFAKDEKGNGYLQLDYDRKTYKSPYSPKYRSPIHIAIFRSMPLTDFVMDVEVMSTTETYGHQDACLFFNMESPEKYYYVHLAPAPDANAHNVFIVNDATRKNLLEPQKKGIEWKKDMWHKLRLARQATTGKIAVYFDDFTTPVLSAEDKTFQTGFVGFGSFDDTARFRNAQLSTKNLTIGKQAEFFKPLGK